MEKIDFNIKNIEFLKCFEYIDSDKDIEIYRLLENIVYNNNPNILEYKNTLSTIGHEEFVKLLKIKNQQKEKDKKTEISGCAVDCKNKRKNIRENMLENFAIRNSKGKMFLKELNMNIFLKNISNKNIIIENGDIIDIIL